LRLVQKLRRVPKEKVILAELMEAQRQLETKLAAPGLTEAAAAYFANAYHRLQNAAKNWTDNKAQQIEVTREMLGELQNEIRRATRILRLPAARIGPPSLGY
jgi:hypothetical protein